MILRHDAPLDDVVVADLGVDPNAEELQRLFDFLEFRTLGIRLGEALAGMGMGLDIGGGEERQELVAEVVDDRRAAEAVELLIGLPRAGDRRGLGRRTRPQRR